MSVEQAAGYAMAPSEDDMLDAVGPHPDDALRNGHRSAARSTALTPTLPALAHSPDQPRLGWLRDTLTGFLHGKAHA